MSKINHTRRKLIRTGLIIAGGCFAGADARALIAHSLRQGKPLLTQENFNELLPAASAPDYAQSMTELAGDIRAFLTRRFALTDKQASEIRSIPSAQLEAVAMAIRDAQRDGLKVQLITGEKARDARAAAPLQLQSRIRGKVLEVRAFQQ